MKLYNVPRNTWVQTEDGTPFFFDHLDGMYSYCMDRQGNVCHYAAYAEVTILAEPPGPPTINP